jgi:hypothetical protein
MKKILLSLALMGLLVGFFAPAVGFAQDTPTESCTIRVNPNHLFTGATCPGAGSDADYTDDYGTVDGAQCCLFSMLLYVINWIFMILMIIVTLFILVGAFTLMTSGGSEEKIAKGRNYIIFALIGLVVALFSRFLPYLIKSIIAV